MALLLQCLRDVRTLAGELDMLPPTADDESHDLGRPPGQHGATGDVAHRLARHPPALAPRPRAEPAEAWH